MRELKVAYGRSSKAKTWKNDTAAWGDLCDRLRTTYRTDETQDEYAAMSKDDRDRA